MNLQEYITSLNTPESKAEKSDLWAGLIDNLNEKLQQSVRNQDIHNMDATIAELDHTLHYNFYFNSDSKELDKKIEQARVNRKNITKELKKLDIPSDILEKENLGSCVFLQSAGLLDEYLDLAKTLKFEPEMCSARHFYYAQKLRKLLQDLNIKQVRALEIGAGGGNLMMLLQHYDLIKDYTIIDLPEMLLLSGLNIEKHLDYKCHFAEIPSTEITPATSYLLPSYMNFSQLPDNIFDLILNVNSFSEMPPSIVDHYFKIIYRTANKGAIFMNVNRVQKHTQNDGSIYEMNPLQFPYGKKDEILEWDADPFQQFVRQFSRLKPVKTTAITRTSRIY